MPAALERKLKAEAKKKGYSKERTNAYVYGTLRKTGWTPSTQKKHRKIAHGTGEAQDPTPETGRYTYDIEMVNWEDPKDPDIHTITISGRNDQFHMPSEEESNGFHVEVEASESMQEGDDD